MALLVAVLFRNSLKEGLPGEFAVEIALFLELRPFVQIDQNHNSLSLSFRMITVLIGLLMNRH